MARNLFEGPCYLCKLPVKVGTGHFERIPRRGWQVKHAKISGDGRITCAEALAKTKKRNSAIRKRKSHAGQRRQNPD